MQDAAPVSRRHVSASFALPQPRDRQDHPALPEKRLRNVPYVNPRIVHDGYPTLDGTAIRDYVHVTGLVNAHTAAVRQLLGGDGGAVNLGTGWSFSVREILDAVERVTGVHVPRRIAARRRGDPAVLVADGCSDSRPRIPTSTLSCAPPMRG